MTKRRQINPRLPSWDRAPVKDAEKPDVGKEDRMGEDDTEESHRTTSPRTSLAD
jgi:hypothetical protein